MHMVLAYLAVLAGLFVLVHAISSIVAWIIFDRVPRPLRPLVDRYQACRRPPRVPMPTVLHELELARLAAEVQRTRAANQPGLAMRVRACTAAYDDVLVRCARDIGVEVPDARPPLSDRQRFDVETGLMAAGLRW